MSAHDVEILGTILFAIALLHTFSVRVFQKLARGFPSGSVAENFFHLLGEIEIVFGLWSAVLIVVILFRTDPRSAYWIVEQQNFREPLFVFAIMLVAATRPVVNLAGSLISWGARALPLEKEAGFLLSALIIGPLLGSLITEPGAMTVTALVLRNRFFGTGRSDRFKYGVLATLFVNVSIGGTLTSFAAPPVLMVAHRWSWDSVFMLQHFGWKAVGACVLNAILLLMINRGELKALPSAERAADRRSPFWLGAIHLAFLALIVATGEHPVIFIAILLFFLGVTEVTREHQSPLKLKESLLVGFFLAGLVMLGSCQTWWLSRIIDALSPQNLFLSATGLTAITDNAALTYLGSLVPNLPSEARHALVAGAVAGGGLTVIANAPNPAGVAILRDHFPDGVISPLKLLIAAILPTVVAMAALWLLPS